MIVYRPGDIPYEERPLELLEKSIIGCLVSHIEEKQIETGIEVRISNNTVRIKIDAVKSDALEEAINECYILRHLNFEKSLVFKAAEK